MVTLIVSVYNSEKYISRCVDSIVAQTYRDIELIIVDDGSTDRSGEISDEYSEMDNRIHVIHKENGGLINARKTGLEAAGSDYVAFVDSDDHIDSNMIEELVSCCEKAAFPDLVISGILRENEDEGKTEKLLNFCPTGKYDKKQLEHAVYPYMLYGFDGRGCDLLQYYHGKLFRKDILIKVLEEIDDRIYDGEDVACIYRYLLCSDSMYVDDAVMYHYIIHEGSMCRSERRENYLVNSVRLHDQLIRSFEVTKYAEIMIPQVERFMSRYINNVSYSLFGFGYGRDNYEGEFWSLPKEVKSKKGKYIVYGAGKVGISYILQLDKLDGYEVVAVADSVKHGKQMWFGEISAPEEINNFDYDYVLISLKSKEDAEQIKKSLVLSGIDKSCIIFESPEYYADSFRRYVK